MIKPGFVTDLKGYKRYFDDLKSIGKIIEIQLLASDLDYGFQEKIDELQDFVSEQRIDYISFHSPDRSMQSVLFEEDDYD